MFGAGSADRAEEQAGEASVSAAAYHQHPGAATDLQQRLRGAPFRHCDLQFSWTLVAEHFVEGVAEELLGGLGRVPTGVRGSCSVIST